MTTPIVPLETIMVRGYKYSDFTNKYFELKRAGMIPESFFEDSFQVYRECVKQGRTEAARNAVLIVLQARGLAVPDEVRERILAQKDSERLKRWLERAAVAASVAAVLDDPT